MIILPIIHVLSVVVDLTSGLNEDNDNTISGQLFSPLPKSPRTVSIKDELKPHPLGGLSPTIDTSQILSTKSSEQSQAFPYLMNVPVFTETFKSTTRQATGAYKRSKESDSGWKQGDNGNWAKYGDEQGSDKHRKNKGQGFHAEGSHKKSLGHDNRDAAEKWKQGSESGEHEDERLLEEYDKSKGKVFEKKWSWEKERGSGHGWANQAHSDQDHWKGSNHDEHEMKSKLNQGKDAWLNEAKKANFNKDEWAGKFLSQGSKEDIKNGHLKQASGADHHDAQYLKQNGYH